MSRAEPDRSVAACNRPREHGRPFLAVLPISEQLWDLISGTGRNSTEQARQILDAVIELESLVERIHLQQRISDLAISRGISVLWTADQHDPRCHFEVSSHLVRSNLSAEEACAVLGIEHTVPH